MFNIIHVRYDQFPVIRTGEHITDSPGRRIEVQAVVSPEAVDALMCGLTMMGEAGPYREGRIRMRAWDFEMPVLVPEGALTIEVGPGVGLRLPLDPESQEPEYSVLFVPPALWRWRSRSGSSWMRIQEDGGDYVLEAVLTPAAASEVLEALYNLLQERMMPVPNLQLLESVVLEIEPEPVQA